MNIFQDKIYLLFITIYILGLAFTDARAMDNAEHEFTVNHCAIMLDAMQDDPNNADLIHKYDEFCGNLEVS